ncbi:MAG: type II secretion system F family protein [Gemmatimonadaceae bacterium]|nr:type II secretion system F family protein [Gemmatimonadaceae bacterium]MCW5826611.1 type II secretion system F family protein [Gemmatimonadaceae bacterium]
MKTSIAAVMRAFDDGRDRSEFYRGWRMGLSAGLTHPAILSKTVARGGATGAIRDHLLAGTSKGKDIASLVRAAPKLFEPFEAALLRMGEESGQLAEMLTHLADFHQRQYRMILQVKKWMTYPMFLTLFAVWVAPLPLIFYGQVKAYFTIVALGLVGWFAGGGVVLAGLAQRYQRRSQFVRARFARTLALCIEAGLPLPRAAMLAAESSGDPQLYAHVRRFGERALASQPLSVTLRGSPILTPELDAALQVAESTGDFGSSLGRLADLYEDGFK